MNQKDKMENQESMDQQQDWAQERVAEIEKKILAPDTSWGELTKLRDELDSLESVKESSGTMTAELARDIFLLRGELQKRINEREPQDIKDMRHELHGLGKDIMKNYKEYIQQWDYPKLFDSVRRALEIEYSSKWKSADLNRARGEKFEQRMQDGEKNIGALTYEQWKNEAWTDLAYVYGITEEQAESLFKYAVSAYVSGDNYMKLTASYILLWLGS